MKLLADKSCQTLDMATGVAMKCFIHGHMQMDQTVQMGNFPQVYIESTALPLSFSCNVHHSCKVSAK